VGWGKRKSRVVRNCKIGLYAGEAFEKRGSNLRRAEGLESEGLEEKRAQAASLNECFTEEKVPEARKSIKQKKTADMLGLSYGGVVPGGDTGVGTGFNGASQ
jgi:hypothetical protein